MNELLVFFLLFQLYVSFLIFFFREINWMNSPCTGCFVIYIMIFTIWRCANWNSIPFSNMRWREFKFIWIKFFKYIRKWLISALIIRFCSFSWNISFNLNIKSVFFYLSVSSCEVVKLFIFSV